MSRFSPFQSSPGLMAGRYHGGFPPLSQVLKVSILARLNGRALPWQRYPPGDCLMFQSSPGLMAGRYKLGLEDKWDPDEVSILARLNGRALRPEIGLSGY